MKGLKPILKKAYIYATYLLVASIPFTENISTIAIAVWVFLGLFHLQRPRTVIRDRRLLQQMLLPLYFVMIVVALIYTEDFGKGLSHLERKVSFFIIPLMVVLSSESLRPYGRQIMKVFILAVVAATLICVSKAFVHSISFGEEGFAFNAAVVLKDKSFWESNNYGGNYFFHEHLSLFKHPSYFAIYICFSLFLLGRNMLINQISLKGMVARIALLLYLLAFLFFLSARISIIYLGLIFILMLVIYFKYLATWSKISIVSVIIVFALVLLKFNYRIENVCNQDLRNSSLLELSQRSNSLKRIVVWKLVSENEKGIRILGTGPGDVHNELDKLYEEGERAGGLCGSHARPQVGVK